MFKIFNLKRFSLLKTLIISFVFLSLAIRIILYLKSLNSIDFSMVHLLKIFGIGLFFDVGVLSYTCFFFALYLWLFPSKFHGSTLDKILIKFIYSLLFFCLIFSFLAEITFWNEYQRRFNFIAVDYLLYTYEVVENIHESYPLPILLSVIIFLCYLCIKFTKQKGAFELSYKNSEGFLKKSIPVFFIGIILTGYHFGIQNKDAEIFQNRYENELSKSGLYSFFAAFKSNELNYDEFYTKIPKDSAFKKVRSLVSTQGDLLNSKKKSIRRKIFNSGKSTYPNIIFIGLESMSARFMRRFGNTENWTPTIDSLANESLFYTNLYALGTRTIRGIEGITLAIPPTPGRSIVKRKQTNPLFTIGSIFKEKGYLRTFFYGGDGHFDNMNNYFENNGFDIVDRKKKYRINKPFNTKRIAIKDDEVSFENAWGVCDEDIYNKLLKIADTQHQTGRPFFNFVMNNSNHHPYTYPDNKINIPSGKGREGAVKYADLALKKFFEKARKKPWFKNTVFVIMSDHCAYSAGRTEINVKSYHIPAMIYNLQDTKPKEIDKLCSQMDIFPTLFGYLNWNYTTNLYGQDIRKMKLENERAFIANYQKLGLLKRDKLLILNSDQEVNYYNWNREKNILQKTKAGPLLSKEIISYYQTAYHMYKSGGLFEKQP